MMRAWLADRKTVTRRLINPQPKGDIDILYPAGPKSSIWFDGMKPLKPRYLPGETVYIKEAWHCDDPAAAQDVMSRGEGLYYKATEVCPEIFPKWKPGMFMPEWASRTKALDESARPERLQDITVNDVQAEGLTPFIDDAPFCESNVMSEEEFIKSYADLWDSINGKKHPWSSNPYVWRYELKKLSGTLPVNIDDFICDACGKVISDDEEFIIGEDCNLHKKCADGLK